MSRKRSFPIAARVTVLLLVLLWLDPVGTARADIAPPPPPEPGSILPGQETQVRMESESVLIDIAPAAGQGAPYAKVTASFTMRNLGEQAEQMDVRFPLNLLYPSYQTDLNACPYPEGGYPEIDDFKAQVAGQPVRVTTLTERLGDPNWGQEVKEVKCWASFPASFPPGEEVLIDVSYTADGYFGWDVDGLVEFPYVLVTGRGWAGAIGNAEIAIRAPFELSHLNLFEYTPDDAQVSGREVRWSFSDLEPEWNISASIVNPHVWEKIIKERLAVAEKPDDGEAWGRLGKAYKEANATRRGYRWDEGAPELYALSRAAYEKSLALLPKDADWHFGYADLLWRNVEYASFGTDAERRDELVLAVEHLRLALVINPRHTRALEMLNAIGHWWMWDEGAVPPVNLSGSRPDFLILTTTPTARPEPTDILTQTPLPSATLPPTAEPPPAAEETAGAAETTISPPTPVSSDDGSARRTPCGAAALPLAAVLAAVAGKLRQARRRSGADGPPRKTFQARSFW